MIKAEYVNHMGDDLFVVDAARVSLNKTSSWDKKFNNNVGEIGRSPYKKDDKLIKYLASNGHWTPFSHPMITMRETVPIFVARQRFKHMVGFTYNEVSRRYVDDTPEFYQPDTIRGRPTDGAKQGSSDSVDGGLEDTIKSVIDDLHETSARNYGQMINDGVAPEQARMILPQSMLTSYYVTGSLYAWARAYIQRSDPHAQKEIRDLASQWKEIIEPYFPVSWEALTGARNG